MRRLLTLKGDAWILTVLLFSMCIPLPLALYYRQTADRLPEGLRWLDSDWLRNRTLVGAKVGYEELDISWQAVSDASLQKMLANNFDRNFPGREAFIRGVNQLYFSAFKTTGSRTSNETVGKEDWLYQKAYLYEYYLIRPDHERLARLVDGLKTLQEICRQHRVGYVVVITPSKANIMKRMNPSSWRKKWVNEPRGYDVLLPMLRDRGIHHVDGIAITEANRKRKYPPFAKGGIHWTNRTAYGSTDAIHQELIRQGLPLRPLTPKFNNVNNPRRALGSLDGDLLNLMNLWDSEWFYPCGEARMLPADPPLVQRPTMLMVGGSFLDSIRRQFADSRQYTLIDHRFYYSIGRTLANDDNTTWYPGTDFSLKLEDDVLSSGCLILELNEQAIPHPDHLEAFLKDVLPQ